MNKMNFAARRPNSSAPHGASVATSVIGRAAQRQQAHQHPYVAHPPPPRTMHENLFSDTYGQLSGTSSPFKSNVSGSGSAGLVSHAYPHHLDTTRSPSEPRPPPAGRACSGTTTATTTSDAIAFQYYARQRPSRHERQGVGRDATPGASAERATTPVRPTQPDVSDGRGVSAPTTPGNRRNPAAVVESNRKKLPTRAAPSRQLPRREAKGTGTAAAARSRSTTPPAQPASAPAARQPATPPRAAAKEVSAASRPFPTHPHTSAEASGEAAVVQALSEQPSSLAQEVLMAAARRYESHRLLHFYGGVYAAAGVTQSAAPSPAVSSSASPPPTPDGGGDNDAANGRAVLLKALRRLKELMDGEGAAPAETERGRRRSRARVRAASDTTAADAASTEKPGNAMKRQGGSPDQRRKPSNAGSGRADAGAARAASANGRAPRQLRGRVMASRVGVTTRNGNAASRIGSATPSAAAPAAHSTRPVHDFMKTIKPPHRHGLGGALPPTSTPSSPRSVAEEAPSSLTTAAAALSRVGDSFDHSPQQPTRESRYESGAPSPDAAAGHHDHHHLHHSPTAPQTTSQEPVRRVLPLSEVLNDALGDGASLADLSPGAAAARRVYWEQHHTLPQRSGSGDPQNSFQFNFVADGAESTAVPRYPDSVSVDHVPRDAAAPQQGALDDVSLDDSVLRSDVHSFPSAPVSGQDIAQPAGVTESASLNAIPVPPANDRAAAQLRP